MSSLLVPLSLFAGFATLVIAFWRTAASLRRDVRADLAEWRAELKGDNASLRAELKGGNASLRAEMKADIAEVRTDIRRLEDRMDRGFAAVHADHRDLRSRVDRITDSLAVRGLIPSEEG